MTNVFPFPVSPKFLVTTIQLSTSVSILSVPGVCENVQPLFCLGGWVAASGFCLGSISGSYTWGMSMGSRNVGCRGVWAPGQDAVWWALGSQTGILLELLRTWVFVGLFVSSFSGVQSSGHSLCYSGPARVKGLSNG